MNLPPPGEQVQTHEGFALAKYNDAYGIERVAEMHCMVHIRREFVKIVDRYKSPMESLALRQEYAKLIFDDL